MNNSALGFILKTKVKNFFKEMVHKPGRLILLIIIIALLFMVFAASRIGGAEREGGYRDISEITAMINVLFIVIFSTTFITALDRGGSIFKMSDVNLIFTGPFSKRSVLFFGLIQQIGSVLFIGVFILYQYGNLSIHYGLSIGAMFLIMLCYSLVVFLAQTMAMFVYIYISDSDEKKKVAKYVFYALLIVLVAIAAATTLLGKGISIETVAAFGNSIALRLFPLAGWLGGFTTALLSGKLVIAAVWFLLAGAAFTVVLEIMAKSKREYYEDVLDSATATFNAMSSAKDGVAPEATPKNIKLGKTGIGKGFGASVFYYKHLLENRRAKVFMMSNMSILFVVMTVGFSFFLRSSGIVPVLAFSAYCGIFTLGTGRFARELTKPFVYLVPEPPVKKLIYILSDTFPSLLVESLVTFIPAGLIVGATPVEFICAALAKCGFSILFVSGSLIIDRLWGGSLSKVVGVLVYFLIDIILAVPGIILGVLAAQIVSGPAEMTVIMLVMTGVNLLVSLLVFFCCRNVLQYSEI